MSKIEANRKNWIARYRHSAPVQYGGAVLAVWVALSFWTFSPLLHRHAFSLFLMAVLFTARFLGLGPAIFCSLLSAACLDFFIFPSSVGFAIIQGSDMERLLVFLAISVFAGSMRSEEHM